MGMAGLLLIGIIWGATNGLLKRGAMIAEDRARRRKEKADASAEQAFWLVRFAMDWLHLLTVWEYSIPFVVNLSASVLFLRALGDNPINVAVPVTNAITFTVTALADAALGERIHIWKAVGGIASIALGIALCITPDVKS